MAQKTAITAGITRPNNLLDELRLRATLFFIIPVLLFIPSLHSKPTLQSDKPAEFRARKI
ncbi:MAG: hypothetical protein JXR23_03530 [Pontiellaceae bacterium]|nr:hypothetical protein [Pontiellaceae bacterium]